MGQGNPARVGDDLFGPRRASSFSRSHRRSLERRELFQPPKKSPILVQQTALLLVLNTEPFELRLSGFRPLLGLSKPRLSGFSRLSRFRFRIRPGKERIDTLFEAFHVLLVRPVESRRPDQQVEELIPIFDLRQIGPGKQQFCRAIGQPEEVEQRNELQQAFAGNAIVPA